MSLNEKTAIKKAVDCFNVSISQLERSINIELKNFLIYTLKSSTMSMTEKQAIKKAVDTFAVSISQMERSISIELKKECL